MTDARALFEAELGRGDWDALQEGTRVAWEQRARGVEAFIPTTRSTILNREVAAEQTLDVPIPAPEVPARVATLAELSECGSVKSALKHALLAGWDAHVTYARGPWVLGSGKVKLIVPGAISTDDEEEADEAGAGQEKVPAIYESLALRARRGGQRVAATWTRRPWTIIGQSGKYQFSGAHNGGAHIWPPLNGGGLHNSKAMLAVLKSEEAPTDE